MKSPSVVVWICGTMLLSACMPSQPPVPPKSQLEIREEQTREYHTHDTKMVMKALVNTLQDDGFIIRNAVTDLGLITATKELEVESAGGGSDMGFGSLLGGPGWHGGGFGFGLGGGGGSYRTKNTIIEASANVSEFGDSTRVRVNFQRKSVDNRGGTLEVHQIDDLKFYQDFFSKVDKGIFIQRERL